MRYQPGPWPTRRRTMIQLLGGSIGSLLLLLSAATAQQQDASHSAKVELETVPQGIAVTLDGQPFTTLVTQGHDKPILFPVFGPGQVSMTRRWPMEEGVAGEAHDHPHHRSIWVGHEVNGLDFWANRSGVIRTKSARIVDSQPEIDSRSQWLRKSDGQVVLEDRTRYRFGADETSRWVDCQITFQATHGAVTFDDTKEGLFAIRTHPDLRLAADPQRGVEQVFGQARNSEGVEGEAIWGKPAKWLLYTGKIAGQPMALAMFDHPDNLRHPTTWHARTYGLVAANPFGLHYFQGLEKGAGAHTLQPGEELTLRYRVAFFKGQPTAEEIERQFQLFAGR